MKRNSFITLAMLVTLLTSCENTNLSSSNNSDIINSETGKESNSSQIINSSTTNSSFVLPETPNIDDADYFNEENVVLSFGAISDTHLSATSKIPTNLLDNVISYLEELNGNKELTGLVIGGDLVDTTWETNTRTLTDFEEFSSYIKNRIDPNKTTLFYTLGNHDIDPTSVRGEDALNVPQYYFEDLGHKYFKNDVNYQDYLGGTKVTGNRHAIINGYHFLSISPKYFWMPNGAFTQESLLWLTNTLDAIVEKNPNQPIFVLSHSPIEDTARLTQNNMWIYHELEDVLRPYHQVIYMSGHIHNLISDELSIEQRDFTMIELGSTKYSSAFNTITSSNSMWANFNGGTKYDNDIGNLMIGSGSYVEIDSEGNVKITRILVNEDESIKGVFGEPWIIPAPKMDKTHLLKYRDDYRIEHNQAPVFNEDASLVTTTFIQDDAHNVRLTLSSADDDQYVEFYQITLKTIYGQTIYSKYYQTFYFKYVTGNQMPKAQIYDIGNIAPGTYVIEVKAGDVWGALSEPISTSIVIE